MNRIELLASLTEGSKVVCDVGCDHAYVLIKAIKYHNVSMGIAADVAAGPLSMARKNIINEGLEEKISLSLSDGFKDINQEFDTAIIAGMGGILISKILNEGINKIHNKKLILAPNSDSQEVRLFLAKNRFMILDEFAIIDQNKYYEIIVAKPGNYEYTEKEITYGPILLKNKPEEFINHYKNKINNLNIAISKINDEEIKNQKIKEIKEYQDIIGE